MRYKECRDAWVFCLRPAELLDRLSVTLRGMGYTHVVEDQGFVYAAGEIPILLVAHVDTVHATPPSRVFYDPRYQLLWAPEGIGADDRAGVLGILWMLRRGYRPHILFTDEEEQGAIGARRAGRLLDPPDVRYMIELDRKNGNDAVFYSCTNKEFQEYVCGFGYKKAEGIFTDISELCPAWKIAGVNLSCGYYNAHTSSEYLALGELRKSVERVVKMLDNPPAERFEYKPRVSSSAIARRASGWSYWDDEHDGYGYGYGYRSWYYEHDVIITIDTFELAAEYGGRPADWASWLHLNDSHLQNAAERAVGATIERLVQDEPVITTARRKAEGR